MFMFITSFALIYVYYGKPFSTLRFFQKRSIGVLLPYCLWSALYTWLRLPNHSLGQYIPTALSDILTGSASYQLYYILLSLQFYLLLPLFLVFIKRVVHHPWVTLSCSFLLQVLLLYLDYHYIQAGPFSSSGVGTFIRTYQDRFVLVYQFYFILGALTALYLPQVRDAFDKWTLYSPRWIVGGFVAALALLWGHFFLQVDVYHESLGRAVAVLQPVMTFYSLAIILLGLCWAWRWAREGDAQGHPRGYHFWKTLSNASFGLYLIHPLFLTFILSHLGPIMPGVWPVALRVFLVWFLTAGASVLTSIVLMNIPIVSRLVGRSAPWPHTMRRAITAPTAYGKQVVFDCKGRKGSDKPLPLQV
jgi:surface polysaccharide O-acyltransferase-like enzyme